MAKAETVYLVGHKDSVKKKDYLAACNYRAEAERIMGEMPEATFIKEVSLESRRR